jgi:CheY-like chemotaxis protein
LAVVEDNKANQKLLMMLLQRLGYAADVANDGLQAVEAWHKKKYDIIVLAPSPSNTHRKLFYLT